MKKTQLDIEKAMAADPSIFEYDNIYDEMQEKKKQEDVRLSSKSKKEVISNKYILIFVYNFFLLRAYIHNFVGSRLSKQYAAICAH